MTENMSDSRPTTKKRKANDGRATVPDSSNGCGGLFSSLLGYFSGRRDDNAQPTSCGGENLTQMDRMENMMQMMIRMEEKQLATVGSLERRCANLEAECSSLRTMLKTKIEQDVRHHEYNNMLVKNQSWKYSAAVHSEEYWENNGHNEDVARHLFESSDYLKIFTETMRKGEFPTDYGNEKGINLEWNEDDPILDGDAISKMSPHWEEFISALKQLTPVFGVLPDGCESFFNLVNVQVPGEVAWLLKDALMDKPFQTLRYMHKTGVDDDEGMSVDSIMDIMKSNKHLRRLSIGNNRIQLEHIEKICSAVRYGSIVELDLYNCFENGLGDAMVTSLLTSGGLAKLEKLDLNSNGITSSSITLLADFLARNSPLKELALRDNGLNNNSAVALANALRSNTSLRKLQLAFNAISHVGKEAFCLVLHNDSNLNSIADSNHSCSVQGVGSDCWTTNRLRKEGGWHDAPESFNRARKIYNLLSLRNKSMSTSNVQYFDGIDVKILPFMLKAVQRYAIAIHPYEYVAALSIVYEVMRKWDKVFPLYTDGGNNDSN